ncbi:MAG: dihydrodipicolinate synthase family protein [Prevotella sp.]|nr:dihydrodipicolinate synthase family protein [Prevotella sp.]
MKKCKKYCGVVVPVVTPVTACGKVDEKAVERIVSNLAKNNVSPLLMGTTGEGNSVSMAQATRMIEAAKRAAEGKVVIYAGLCGCCWEEQMEAAKRFVDAGADVIAATLPSYYALTAEQMEAYYQQLADNVTVPLMLYNITITTHMSIPLDVVERLSHHPNIVGLKDSENNLPRMQEALEMFADRDDFSYFCGCAANSAAAMAWGADGIVPSVGNYWPEAYQQLYEAGVEGRKEDAEHWQQLTIEIGKINTQGLTLGQSLSGLKVIMKMLGLCDEYMLPPLTEVSEEKKSEIRSRFNDFCEQTKEITFTLNDQET